MKNDQTSKTKPPVYQVQYKKAVYRHDGGYWQDIKGEVRIIKDDEIILHLDAVKEIQPIKFKHHELK